MSIESVMPSNHFIFCHPLLLLSWIFPSIRVFSSELVFHIRWTSTRVSASASVLPIYIQGWFPLGLTSWISLQSKGLSRVFSSTTVQKHQFFSTLNLSQFSNLPHTVPCYLLAALRKTGAKEQPLTLSIPIYHLLSSTAENCPPPSEGQSSIWDPDLLPSHLPKQLPLLRLFHRNSDQSLLLFLCFFLQHTHVGFSEGEGPVLWTGDIIDIRKVSQTKQWLDRIWRVRRS